MASVKHVAPLGLTDWARYLIRERVEVTKYDRNKNNQECKIVKGQSGERESVLRGR